MSITLYPPQARAVEIGLAALEQGKNPINASQTGTGKTFQALAITAARKRRPLVVAPLSALPTWRNLAPKFGVELLDAVNIEYMRTGKTQWVKFRDSKNYLWTLPNDVDVIIDEIHRGCSGRNTASGRMVAMLRPQKIPVQLLSATPFASPLNMRSTGYLLGLHNYDAASYFRWCRAHGCVNDNWGGIKFPKTEAARIHLERINKALKEQLIRVTMDDLKEFFPGGSLVVPTLVDLGQRPTEEANAIYAEMNQELKKTSHVNAMVAMLRARQRVELLKVPAIVDEVEDLLEEGYSVFAGVGFRDSAASIQKLLTDRGISFVTIMGGQSAAEREVAVNMFQADLVQVLVSTVQSGGESISLHHTRVDQRPRASVLCITYSASELIQVLGRIRRAGALSPALQKIMLAAGTLEELRVYPNLMLKVGNIDTLVDADLGAP